jgi:membrane-bound metal-dependent hydrolase YbcI (DUF457 family)
MFIGHYGVSFAAKKWARAVPLAVLFIAVQLLDVGWSILVLLGIEKVRIVPGITKTNPLDLYYMPYTHSLVAALVWSVAAYAIYRLVARGSKWAAGVVAGAVFSHWVLDLLVHRPDLALYDNTAKVGLGLWNYPVIAFLLEVAILFGGLGLYFTTGIRRRAGFIVFGLEMFAIQAYVFFGPPPGAPQAAAVMALVFYLLFAWIAGWLERRASA